jgi:predicted acylesterase/phospholipase RssA
MGKKATAIKTLCFGPGGVRGFAFLGALQDLQESDELKTYGHFSGISVGSILALCLALGYSVDEMIEMALTISLKSIVTTSVQTMLAFKETWAMLDPAGLRALLSDILRKKGRDPEALMLSDLPRFSCVVSDMTHSRPLLLQGNSRVLVLDAVQASCAIPLAFPPVTVDGFTCVDGCLYSDCASQLLNADTHDCTCMVVVGKPGPAATMSMFTYLEAVVMEPRRRRMRSFYSGLDPDRHRVIEVDGVQVLQSELGPESRRTTIRAGRKKKE